MLFSPAASGQGCVSAQLGYNKGVVCCGGSGSSRSHRLWIKSQGNLLHSVENGKILGTWRFSSQIIAASTSPHVPNEDECKCKVAVLCEDFSIWIISSHPSKKATESKRKSLVTPPNEPPSKLRKVGEVDSHAVAKAKENECLDLFGGDIFFGGDDNDSPASVDVSERQGKPKSVQDVRAKYRIASCPYATTLEWGQTGILVLLRGHSQGGDKGKVLILDKDFTQVVDTLSFSDTEGMVNTAIVCGSEGETNNAMLVKALVQQTRPAHLKGVFLGGEVFAFCGSTSGEVSMVPVRRERIGNQKGSPGRWHIGILNASIHRVALVDGVLVVVTTAGHIRAWSLPKDSSLGIECSSTHLASTIVSTSFSSKGLYVLCQGGDVFHIRLSDGGEEARERILATSYVGTALKADVIRLVGVGEKESLATLSAEGVLRHLKHDAENIESTNRAGGSLRDYIKGISRAVDYIERGEVELRNTKANLASVNRAVHAVRAYRTAAGAPMVDVECRTNPMDEQPSLAVRIINKTPITLDAAWSLSIHVSQEQSRSRRGTELGEADNANICSVYSRPLNGLKPEEKLLLQFPLRDIPVLGPVHLQPFVHIQYPGEERDVVTIPRARTTIDILDVMKIGVSSQLAIGGISTYPDTTSVLLDVMNNSENIMVPKTTSHKHLVVVFPFSSTILNAVDIFKAMGIDALLLRQGQQLSSVVADDPDSAKLCGWCSYLGRVEMKIALSASSSGNDAGRVKWGKFTLSAPSLKGCWLLVSALLRRWTERVAVSQGISRSPQFSDEYRKELMKLRDDVKRLKEIVGCSQVEATMKTLSMLTTELDNLVSKALEANPVTRQSSDI